ncbi:hypothetical protein [Streptomyces sp. NPDC002265]|uniref:hypothetical protein n=1 Tax=Streptomyces sp. NPDC002265 TaxID=3154415 RepID=UPI003324499B
MITIRTSRDYAEALRVSHGPWFGADGRACPANRPELPVLVGADLVQGDEDLEQGVGLGGAACEPDIGSP